MLRKYFAYVNGGCNFSSKLRMAIIIAFSNHIILGMVPANIGKILIDISNWLSLGVISNVNGLKYRMIDYSSSFVCTPFYEAWSGEYLQLKEGDVFLDIGAHIGRYTLPVARAVGENGLVIAVEASSRNYDCLNNNIKLNNLHNVIAINAAAWSSNDDLKYYPGKSSATGSIIGDKENEGIKVQGRSSDSLLEELNREAPVNWIKIDVEGVEIEVLKGLSKTLLKNKPKLIVEVLRKNIKKFENYMEALNYHYHSIPDSRSIGGDDMYYYCWKNEDVHGINGEKNN